jgi:predicted nucleotidyltransferase
MTTLDSTIETIRERYPYLSREYGIRKIGLFGSVAKKTERIDSDIDIVVELAKPIGLKFVELTDYLETLFDRRVDVLTQEGIDNIRIKDVADDIKRTIIYV